MEFASFLIQTLNSLQYGLLLFLVASGLTLVFGIMGIINLAHGSSNVDYYIEHNNINLNPTDANCSNVCIELGTKNGINHFIFNNIFSNKTPNQTSPLYHSIYYSPGNYSMGTGGFNYNSFYFENNTGAFFGVTPIGNFPSKADWDGNIYRPRARATNYRMQSAVCQ